MNMVEQVHQLGVSRSKKIRLQIYRYLHIDGHICEGRNFTTKARRVVGELWVSHPRTKMVEISHSVSIFGIMIAIILWVYMQDFYRCESGWANITENRVPNRKNRVPEPKKPEPRNFGSTSVPRSEEPKFLGNFGS